MDNSLIRSFADLEIFLTSTSDNPFHYVSGGVGPYYIDLRRGPNDPTTLNSILDKYEDLISRKPDEKLLLVGVPTTGVIYATGLALRYGQALAVMEKLNPSRIHTFNPKVLEEALCRFDLSLDFENLGKTAFLGLEDMGVIFATAMGLRHSRPSAILRRTQKGHGTSKTIEGNLGKMWDQGIRTLCVFNDPYHPMTSEEIISTLRSIPGCPNFGIEVLDHPTLVENHETKEDIGSYRVLEIEDLWTTGTSAINLYGSIKKNLGVSAEVFVFLDREQQAMRKFNLLGIPAKSVYKISEVAKYLLDEDMITTPIYSEVMSYAKTFDRPLYMETLAKLNESCVCVGLDITPGKLPEKPEDTNLPHYPYARNAEGVRLYCMDLLDEVVKVPGVKVIKPNLAYYNSLSDASLHSILQDILVKAKELGLLVILDTKIGDIMRTQSQYAEKYRDFDAVTVHGYMGGDSVFPITDATLGAYVLVFTSNPSREDLETQPIMTEDLLYDVIASVVDGGESRQNAIKGALLEAPKVYEVMTQKVIDWQFAGSVGAVVGGTPNSFGLLEELHMIVTQFAEGLGYLPPILIPGVGTQGGSAKDVMRCILVALSSGRVGWSKEKILAEIRKVSINSSSGIGYSPRPADAIRLLKSEIEEAISSFF